MKRGDFLRLFAVVPFIGKGQKCEGCGAPLSGPDCEYCGNEYEDLAPKVYEPRSSLTGSGSRYSDLYTGGDFYTSNW